MDITVNLTEYQITPKYYKFKHQENDLIFTLYVKKELINPENLPVVQIKDNVATSTSFNINETVTNST